MDEFKISLWKDEDGSWCYQMAGDNRVYVMGTKRSMLNAVERELNKHYQLVKEDE